MDKSPSNRKSSEEYLLDRCKAYLGDMKMTNYPSNDIKYLDKEKYNKIKDIIKDN